MVLLVSCVLCVIVAEFKSKIGKEPQSQAWKTVSNCLQIYEKESVRIWEVSTAEDNRVIGAQKREERPAAAA
jgi:hypothetical protein